MTLTELNSWFNSFLKIEDYPADPSMNGIQVQNSAPDEKQIKKAAFAVDACLETIEKAAEQNADILFVHHGLFWGSAIPLTGSHYDRINALIKNDIALFACHIPLDANNPYGNNYGMAERLGLQEATGFGIWRGMSIGVAGVLPEPLTCRQIAEKLLGGNAEDAKILPFGPELIKSVAIVSGGAGDEVEQAIDAGYDCYITGEIGHEQYHPAKEAGITVIAGGHYNTEVYGPSLVMQKLRKETGIETVWVSAPTGL